MCMHFFLPGRSFTKSLFGWTCSTPCLACLTAFIVRALFGACFQDLFFLSKNKRFTSKLDVQVGIPEAAMVKPGWRIEKVNGQQFSLQKLEQAAASSKPYDLTFCINQRPYIGMYASRFHLMHVLRKKGGGPSPLQVPPGGWGDLSVQLLASWVADKGRHLDQIPGYWTFAELERNIGMHPLMAAAAMCLLNPVVNAGTRAFTPAQWKQMWAKMETCRDELGFNPSPSALAQFAVKGIEPSQEQKQWTRQVKKRKGRPVLRSNPAESRPPRELARRISAESAANRRQILSRRAAEPAPQAATSRSTSAVGAAMEG